MVRPGRGPKAKPRGHHAKSPKARDCFLERTNRKNSFFSKNRRWTSLLSNAVNERAGRPLTPPKPYPFTKREAPIAPRLYECGRGSQGFPFRNTLTREGHTAPCGRPRSSLRNWAQATGAREHSLSDRRDPRPVFLEGIATVLWTERLPPKVTSFPVCWLGPASWRLCVRITDAVAARRTLL